jgi:hypothetical protein
MHLSHRQGWESNEQLDLTNDRLAMEGSSAWNTARSILTVSDVAMATRKMKIVWQFSK